MRRLARAALLGTCLLTACPSSPRATTRHADWTRAGNEQLRAFRDALELEQAVRTALATTAHDRADDPLDPSQLTPSPPQPPQSDLLHRRARTLLESDSAPRLTRLHQHGSHLVLLRNGRLSTLRTDAARPLAVLDLPHATPSNQRDDALLLGGDRAVAVSYREDKGALEVLVAHVGSDGSLEQEQLFWLRASTRLDPSECHLRLDGSRLVLYLPAVSDTAVQYPAQRTSSDGAWVSIAKPQDIFGGLQAGAVIHALVSCDLQQRPAPCTAMAVLAPQASAVHATPEALYVWSEEHELSRSASPVLYRLPIAGAPGALRVSGMPLGPDAFDQGPDGLLRVLVQLRGKGLHDESAHAAVDELALARIPVGALGGPVATLQPAAYQPLPDPDPEATVRARFAAGKLLYAPVNGGLPATLQVVDVAGSGATRAIQLDHSVDRIDTLGPGGLITGRNTDSLVLSTLDLTTGQLSDREVLRDDPTRGVRQLLGTYPHDSSEQSGVLVLPIYGAPDYIAGRATLEYAQVAVYRRTGLRLERIGELDAVQPENAQKPCADACADWYEAMSEPPLFDQQRLIVALGSEIITAELGVDRIIATQRTTTSPGPY